MKYEEFAEKRNKIRGLKEESLFIEGMDINYLYNQMIHHPEDMNENSSNSVEAFAKFIHSGFQKPKV